MKQSSAHLQLILKALLQAGRRLHFTLLASFMALIFSWGKSQAASYSSNVLGALPPGSEDDDADLFGISEGKLLQFLPADDSTLHGLGISREELNADSIYLSDLNSDGSTDLIYLGESGVAHLERSIDGRFELKSVYGIHGLAPQAAFGDINGDRHLDIVVHNPHYANEFTHLDFRNGALRYQGRLPAHGDLFAGFADFNNDSYLSLLSFNVESSRIYLLETSSTLSLNPFADPYLSGAHYSYQASDFAQTTNLLSLNSSKLPNQTYLGDFNDDQRTDMLVAHPYGTELLLNNGAFGGPLPYGTDTLFNHCQLNFTAHNIHPTNTYGIAVGAINGDHRPDIVLAAEDGLHLYVSQDDGFAPRETIDDGFTRGIAVEIVDWDGDGDADIVASSDDIVRVYENTGNAQFVKKMSGSHAFTEWAESYGFIPTQISQQTNFAASNMQALTAFAFNLNPLQVASQSEHQQRFPSSRLAVGDDQQNYFLFSYAQRSGGHGATGINYVADGIRYKIEVSHNLIDWTDANALLELVDHESLADQMERVTLRIRQHTAQTPFRAARLRIDM